MNHRRFRTFSLFLMCFPGLAIASAQEPPSNTRPDHRASPGMTNPNVTQANIKTTICKSGWTDTIRPPASYTTTLKQLQLKNLGDTDKNTLPLVRSASGTTKRPDVAHCKEHSSNEACWEEDHLISLELGGHPRNPDNLWPEPWSGPWNAHVKDALETTLKIMVCHGDITLAEAQKAIATDWVAAYHKFVGDPHD
jgi:hypothetical protein